MALPKKQGAWLDDIKDDEYLYREHIPDDEESISSYEVVEYIAKLKTPKLLMVFGTVLAAIFFSLAFLYPLPILDETLIQFSIDFGGIRQADTAVYLVSIPVFIAMLIALATRDSVLLKKARLLQTDMGLYLGDIALAVFSSLMYWTFLFFSELQYSALNYVMVNISYTKAYLFGLAVFILASTFHATAKFMLLVYKLQQKQ